MNTNTISSLLCIPKMEKNIKIEYIQNIFNQLKIGTVEKIIEIPTRNDPLSKRVQIKINWNNTLKSQYIQSRIAQDQPINIVHAEPHFWKIFLYKEWENRSRSKP